MSEGLVATSQPLAVAAGTAILEAGGSAVDAAVAAAAVLTVVEPRSTGLGGDLFALVWNAGDERPAGLRAAGVAPAGLDVAALRAAGFTSMPRYGAWTVTVPGAPAGWQELLRAYGRLPLERVLADAVRLAREGFAVTPTIAEEWGSTTQRLAADAAAAAVYLPGGRAPAAGETFTNPLLAASLEAFVAEGAAPFYTGGIAEAIGAAVQALGGPLTADDLAAWGGPDWTEPIVGRFRGVDVYEMPPPNHGIVTLEALAIYDGFGPATGDEADHRLLEALKAAIDDAAAVVADPVFAPDRSRDLLDPAYVAARRARIGERASTGRSAGLASDTVYIAVVDGEGNACSLIQSVYEGFGSSVGVPGTGIVLQNRGAGFTLADGHPNRPEPRKRPFHTIIPAMAGRDGRLQGAFGVVGGYMQPQGQAQVLRRLLDEGMEPQAAVDAPRLRVTAGTTVLAEPGYDPRVLAALADRGHDIAPLPRFEAGGAQVVWRTADGFAGGSDPRKDGVVGVARAR